MILIKIRDQMARYFDISPQFWLGLQIDYDLEVTAEEIGDRLQREIAVMAA